MKSTRGRLRTAAAGGRGFGAAPVSLGFKGLAPTQNQSGLAYISERHDLAAIADANAVVIFKNLLKKDSTTKARALEDLLAHVQAHPHETGGTEEGILEVWVQLFPRLSIDDSRKVRELSHTVQYELLKSARKRMEKYIPKVVGPWLAGTFDRDRAVSRAAHDGVSAFLNTEEKTLLFWTKCQSKILEYATEAVKETSTTLSDMRSSTKEDADLKHHRVVYSCLSLVLALLKKLAHSETESQAAGYQKFLSSEPLLRSAISNDSHVRKAAYELFDQALQTHPAFLEDAVPRLTKLMAEDALKISQAGSVIAFLRLLTRLSTSYPDVWSGGKQQPFTRLQPLIEKGSQGSISSPASSFWTQLDILCATLPQDITSDSAADVLLSFRKGINSREEPHSNAVDAWTTYLSTVKRFVSTVTPQDARTALIETHVFPLIENFVSPTQKSVWGTSAHVPIVTRAALLSARSKYADIVESSKAEWTKIADAFAKRMANSLPEVSKDYAKSQKAIADEGDRWFSLLADIHHTVEEIESSATTPSNLIEDLVQQPSIHILESAIDLLKRRNYKPFGAAEVANAAFVHAPHILKDVGPSIIESLFADDNETIPLLLESSSASPLLSCLRSVAKLPEYSAVYKSTFTAIALLLLQRKDDERTPEQLSLLVTGASDYAISLIQGNQGFQECLKHVCYKTARGETPHWELFKAAFSTDALVPVTGPVLTASVVHLLGSSDAEQASVMKALEIIASERPELLLRDDVLHLELVTRLLTVKESGDALLSPKADNLKSILSAHSNKESPMLKIIQENLDNAGPESLEIDTVVAQAVELSKTATAEEKENLFPNTNTWMDEILEFLQGELSPTLSLTTYLGNAYFLLGGGKTQRSTLVRRDRHGKSIPARMAAYITIILQGDHDLSSLPQPLQVELLCMLYLVAEAGSDQIVLADKNSFWGNLSEPWALSAAEDSVADIHKALAKVAGSKLQESTGRALVAALLQQTRQFTPLAVYSSRALTNYLQARADSHGFSPAEEDYVTKLDLWKPRAETALGSMAVLLGYGDLLAPCKAVSNFCNRLISDVADAKAEKESTLSTLAMLEACMSVYEQGELPVATNRLVFALRQITSWFGDDETKPQLDPRLSAQSCRVLERLLPCVKDIYGPYWERCIKFCLGLWSGAANNTVDARLPYIHASLKLMQTMETIPEPNDDLEDALKTFAKDKSQGLLSLLCLSRSTNMLPQQIVDDLLCRMTDKIPLEHVKDLTELYGLMASDSREIQTASFNILHRAIPAAQEELSLNAILDKTEAALPDELLSLLLDAPTLEAYPDDELAKFPTPVQSYLLSWRLVFDAFIKAPAKVRADYAEQLSKAKHVAALLDFSFDVMGHSAGHPLNVDKEGITTQRILEYDIRIAEQTEGKEQNMHWLLVHLYYLCLRYLPGQARAWYADCRSKQTKLAVGTWTANFISTPLMGQVFDEVVAWADSQDPPAADEQELEVKVNRASREVVASYEVDDQHASIAIRLPVNYPVDNVTVVGINRVGANEKKWQSWLMITQGVIAFSNGSIIEGLAAFRRNILGALKGQSECAICYSIVSVDKRMPDKRCSTCKNLFHRFCLYRWLQTAHQNTCPLCRTQISLSSDRDGKSRPPRG